MYHCMPPRVGHEINPCNHKLCQELGGLPFKQLGCISGGFLGVRMVSWYMLRAWGFPAVTGILYQLASIVYICSKIVVLLVVFNKNLIRPLKSTCQRSSPHGALHGLFFFYLWEEWLFSQDGHFRWTKLSKAHQTWLQRCFYRGPSCPMWFLFEEASVIYLPNSKTDFKLHRVPATLGDLSRIY